MKLPSFLLLWMTAALLASCSLTHEGFVFKDPKVSLTEFRGLQRVAIVPNRLPLLMVNTEQWRRRNWEIVRREFEHRAFKVVDYDTSVHAFEESGLPLEDSTAVRDKYAQLCEDLLVDAIIIPYYATIADTSGAVFITHSYHSLATFQIYLKRTNHFITRLDASATSDYHTGFTVGAGILSAISNGAVLAASLNNANLPKEASLGVLFGGLGLTILGAITDIGSGAKSKETHWTEAFAEAIPKGLEPVFSMLLAALESDAVTQSAAAEHKEVSLLLTGSHDADSAHCLGHESDCEKECQIKHRKQSCAALAQICWAKGERVRCVAYYKIACDLGAYVACNTLGNLYQNGLGVSKNIEQALEYFDTACGDGGEGAACQRAGALYEQGQGVAKNLARALEYYQKGCKQGHKSACESVEKLTASKRGN